jgi:hypothetical protein
MKKIRIMQFRWQFGKRRQRGGMRQPHGVITVLMSDERTLSTPLNTVAKLPLPISSSILNDPTVVSPIFSRLDDEDWGGLAAMLDGLSTDHTSLPPPTCSTENVGLSVT